MLQDFSGTHPALTITQEVNDWEEERDRQLDPFWRAAQQDNKKCEITSK